MNRQQVLEAQILDYEHRQHKANAPETLQEDKAFMNRMQKVRFHNFSEGEMRRLWRIGLRGIEARDINQFIRK